MTRASPKLLTSTTYYLAEVEGEPVGCGGWTREEPGTDKVVPALAHIRHFGVAAGWAGQGIGRALYARSEADAQRGGVKQFECFASLNGEAFYKALGFAAVHPISVRMGTTLEFPGILMRRAI
jgi:GNAT superfamily N-acetyltransferase